MSIVSLLQRHPFPVAAYFDRVVALSFAFPEAVLRPLVPSALSIDSYNGLGFITVAMVWTRHLRPAGLPQIVGQDFFLAGYRVFTRFQEPSGRRLRGLRILRSDTDKQRMVWLGNLLTGYRYHRVDVSVTEQDGATHVVTRNRDGRVTLNLTFRVPDDDATLPTGSPFADWATARRFAGPMPFTFSPESNETLVIVEGARQHWIPRPIAVSDWHVGFFDDLPLRGSKPVLANAFTVEHVPYRWKRGRVVHLKQTAS